MRIGGIFRCDNTGLGIQSMEFFNHIPCKPFVIDCSALGKSPVLTPYPHRYNNAPVFKMQKGQSIPEERIQDFLKDIDVLFAMETPYNYRFFEVARKKRIKTILQFNYEFLEYPSNLPMPDLLASPSHWNYEEVPRPKMFLPVPVNTHKFKPNRQERVFIHIAGRPAVHDRNGTQVLLNAVKYIQSECKIIIRTPERLAFSRHVRNVKLEIDRTERVNYQDAYTGGVLIMPRKYGGLCLPINEALAAEMPVIAPDISPNNLWLPKEWLTPASWSQKLNARKVVDVYEPDARALAAKIDQFCDPVFYDQAILKAHELKNTISWETLLPLYHQTFEKLCS